MNNHYDAIVIGAGLGGLFAAAMLAKSGLSVLLLERHNVQGGCATSVYEGMNNKIKVIKRMTRGF